MKKHLLLMTTSFLVLGACFVAAPSASYAMHEQGGQDDDFPTKNPSPKATKKKKEKEKEEYKEIKLQSQALEAPAWFASDFDVKHATDNQVGEMHKMLLSLLQHSLATKNIDPDITLNLNENEFFKLKVLKQKYEPSRFFTMTNRQEASYVAGKEIAQLKEKIKGDIENSNNKKRLKKIELLVKIKEGLSPTSAKSVEAAQKDAYEAFYALLDEVNHKFAKTAEIKQNIQNVADYLAYADNDVKQLEAKSKIKAKAKAKPEPESNQLEKYKQESADYQNTIDALTKSIDEDLSTGRCSLELVTEKLGQVKVAEDAKAGIDKKIMEIMKRKSVVTAAKAKPAPKPAPVNPNVGKTMFGWKNRQR